MENQNNNFENTQAQENPVETSAPIAENTQPTQNTQETSGVYYQNPPIYQDNNQGQYDSYEAYPQNNAYNAQPQKDSSKGLQIASLALGIMSLVCCCCGLLSVIMAIIGLILGIVGLSKAKESSSPNGMAIGGIITSAVGIVLTIFAVIFSLVIESQGVYDDFVTEFENGFNEGYYGEYYDDYYYYEDFDISFEE